jgi:2-desacetyl-2-hydroxyethyl bacteriochlorophyllide A dehydrogenase
MKAVVLEKPGKFSLEELETPEEPGSGKALVRVRRIGICGTDLHAFRGTHPLVEYPRILGHELGVEVIAVDKNDKGLKVGDRCAVEPYLTCGSCVACRRGNTNCCVDLKCLGVHTDGGMQDRMILPLAKLHKSDTLSLDQLALVETLGIGAHAVERASLSPGDNTLVIGVGPIGMSVVEFAKQKQAQVVVMDLNQRRLDFCHRTLGIEHCVNGKSDPARQLQEILSGELPITVFDCTGNPQSMMNAFEYVAHSGTLVFVGLFPGNVTFYDPAFHMRELTLLSSRNATGKEHVQIIKLMEAGRIAVGSWITHRISSTSIADSFPQWINAESAHIKAIVDW